MAAMYGFSSTRETGDPYRGTPYVSNQHIRPSYHGFVNLSPAITVTGETPVLRLAAEHRLYPLVSFPKLGRRLRTLPEGAEFVVVDGEAAYFFKIDRHTPEGETLLAPTTPSSNFFAGDEMVHHIPYHGVWANTRVMTLGVSDTSSYTVEIARVYAYDGAPPWRPFLLDKMVVTSDLGTYSGYVLGIAPRAEDGGWVGGRPRANSCGASKRSWGVHYP